MFKNLIFTFLICTSSSYAAMSRPQISVSTNANEVVVSWNAVDGSNAYKLYYAPYPYTGESSIASINIGAELSMKATLANGAAYYVAVTAYADAIESSYSNIELFKINELSSNLPKDLVMKPVTGGTFTMGDNALKGPQSNQATEHQVTLSDYQMSETEISNAQYLEFLNAALADGLIKVEMATSGADNGSSLVVGSNTSTYQGKVLYNLSGSRVMKDHDNADGDGDPFTGVIEPENPLNIAYIAYKEADKTFYIKDPLNPNDFNWKTLTNYYNYSTTSHALDTSLELNDFEQWSELSGWSESNPQGATALPTQQTVSNYPVSFIRWWGAYAFADYYQLKIPTEAQWEYAAKGGNNFYYAVYDGQSVEDANYNITGLHPATHHLRVVKSGNANPYGLYNLAGNAWEWIADNYAAYSSDSVTDPLITIEGSTTYSWRGGSWNYHQATLETAGRYFDIEDRGNDHFGFRVVDHH